MSRATISARIKVDLTSSGCFNIFERLRWTNNIDQFHSWFDKTVSGKTHVEAWFIQRAASQEQFHTIGSTGSNLAVDLWKITGLYSLNDDDNTETTFQDLIETIRATFRTDYNLNGTCRTICPEWGPGAGRFGIQCNVIDERMFCRKVLCHYCELSLATEYQTSRS